MRARWWQLDGSAALAPDWDGVSAPATAGTHQTAATSNRADGARQLDPRLDPYRLTSPPAVTTSRRPTTSSLGCFTRDADSRARSYAGRCSSLSNSTKADADQGTVSSDPSGESAMGVHRVLAILSLATAKTAVGSPFSKGVGSSGLPGPFSNAERRDAEHPDLRLQAG